MVDDAAPGWQDIEAVFQRLYPGIEPKHWGSPMPSRLIFGGPEALDGISAYTSSGRRHWVTFGLSELYARDGERSEWSGWGYELTLRSSAEADWPLGVLRSLANWGHSSRVVMSAGDTLPYGKPLVAPDPCDLTGVAFVTDPELPPLDTVNGRLEFLQVVGLRDEELAAWDTREEEIISAGALTLNTLSRPPVI